MGNLIKGIIIGFLLCAFGCAGAVVFPYKFYNIQVASYIGKLLGPTPADDLDFSKCAENECVLMLRPEFDAMETDYKTTKSDLITCQKGQ